MSVLQRKRSLSSMEYVSNAKDIEIQSVEFVKRLSAKNARIYQDDVVRLSMLQFELAYIANEIFPTNKAEYQIRHMLHGASMAVLHALDVRMANVYEALMENPKDAFNRKNGKPVEQADAIRILDGMSEKLGCAIDRQDNLLKGIRDSDRKRSVNLPDADPLLASTLSESLKWYFERVTSVFI